MPARTPTATLLSAMTAARGRSGTVRAYIPSRALDGLAVVRARRGTRPCRRGRSTCHPPRRCLLPVGSTFLQRHRLGVAHTNIQTARCRLLSVRGVAASSRRGHSARLVRKGGLCFVQSGRGGGRAIGQRAHSASLALSYRPRLWRLHDAWQGAFCIGPQDIGRRWWQALRRCVPHRGVGRKEEERGAVSGRPRLTDGRRPIARRGGFRPPRRRENVPTKRAKQNAFSTPGKPTDVTGGRVSAQGACAACEDPPQTVPMRTVAHPTCTRVALAWPRCARAADFSSRFSAANAGCPHRAERGTEARSRHAHGHTRPRPPAAGSGESEGKEIHSRGGQSSTSTLGVPSTRPRVPPPITATRGQPEFGHESSPLFTLLTIAQLAVTFFGVGAASRGRTRHDRRADPSTAPCTFGSERAMQTPSHTLTHARSAQTPKLRVARHMHVRIAPCLGLLTETTPRRWPAPTRQRARPE
jgi:hypothetical protein